MITYVQWASLSVITALMHAHPLFKGMQSAPQQLTLVAVPAVSGADEPGLSRVAEVSAMHVQAVQQVQLLLAPAGSVCANQAGNARNSLEQCIVLLQVNRAAVCGVCRGRSRYFKSHAQPEPHDVYSVLGSCQCVVLMAVLFSSRATRKTTWAAAVAVCRTL